MKSVTMTLMELMKVSDAMTELIECEEKFPIGVAYRLARINSIVKEAESFTMDRFGKVVDLNKENLTDDERDIVDALMATQIRIDVPDITESEILSGEGVNISIGDIASLLPLMS